MKKAALALTVLFTLGILPGAVMDLVQPQMVLDIVEPLGIPTHILTLMGILKLSGVVGLWIPRMPRLREWVYAGFVFDLLGAAWWHGASGDTPGVFPPLVLMALLLAGYFLRHKTAEADTAAA